MKKKIILLLCLMFIFSFFTGCSNSKSDDANATDNQQQVQDNSKEELESLWNNIEGYWTKVGDYDFVYFGYEGNNPVFNAAIWRSEIYANATIKEYNKSSDYEYELTICFPAEEANDLYDGIDERTLTITINTEMFEYNKIKVKGESGPFYEYKFTGKTMEEAWENLDFE